MVSRVGAGSPPVWGFSSSRLAISSAAPVAGLRTRHSFDATDQLIVGLPVAIDLLLDHGIFPSIATTAQKRICCHHCRCATAVDARGKRILSWPELRAFRVARAVSEYSHLDLAFKDARLQVPASDLPDRATEDFDRVVASTCAAYARQ